MTEPLCLPFGSRNLLDEVIFGKMPPFRMGWYRSYVCVILSSGLWLKLCLCVCVCVFVGVCSQTEACLSSASLAALFKSCIHPPLTRTGQRLQSDWLMFSWLEALKDRPKVPWRAEERGGGEKEREGERK